MVERKSEWKNSNINKQNSSSSSSRKQPSDQGTSGGKRGRSETASSTTITNKSSNAGEEEQSSNASTSPDIVMVSATGEEIGGGANTTKKNETMLPQRQTAGGRLGGIIPAPPLSPTQSRNKEELENLTQKLRNVTMSAGRTGEQKQENQQQQQNEKEKKPYVGFGFQDPSVREVPFIPAWETKIGQLQSSCYTLRRFSSEYLKTKGSLILRCYPMKDDNYMQQVIYLIDTVVNNEALGPHGPPQSIPLPYEESFTRTNAYGVTYKIADRMLIRIKFENPGASDRFIPRFNMMARQLFSTNPTLNGHSPPFAHPDATYPERKLRIKLQEFCREKNAAIGNFGGERRYNSYFSNDQRFRPTSERYTHDGIKLYKQSPFGNMAYGNIEFVQIPQNTELQHLQTSVLTLRKYAAIQLDKRLSAIIVGMDVAGGVPGSPEDTERIKQMVYKIVLSPEFRQKVPGATEVLVQEAVRVPRLRPLPVRQEGDTRPPAPPLVRASFQTPEASLAFLQLFRQFAAEEDENNNNNGSGGKQTNTTNSNSSNDQANRGGFGRRRPPRLRAHRDLCPPELALHYAQLQYCREMNVAANSLREEKEKLVEKEANNNDDAEQPGTSQGHEGGQKGPATLKIHIVRNYRIFEKTIVPAATVAASSSSVA